MFSRCTHMRTPCAPSEYGEQLKAYLEWSARYFAVDAAGRVSLNDSFRDTTTTSSAGRGTISTSAVRLEIASRVFGPRSPRGTERQLHNGDQQLSAKRRGRIRHGSLRAGRLRSGRKCAELLMADIRSTGRVDPGNYAAADWRIVPETYAVQVRNLFGIAPQPLPSSPKDSTVLRILATADLRAEMLGGAAPAAAAMDSLASSCACASLRLDTGDRCRAHRSPARPMVARWSRC